MTIERLARIIATYLSHKSGEPEKVEVLTFGLQLILGELIKYTMLIVLGLALDKLLIILLITGSFGLFRIVSGGVHLSSYEKCMVVTVLTITGLAYIAGWLATVATIGGLYGVLAVAFLFLVWLVHYLVPVDCANRPIESDSLRSKFKIWSLLVVVASFLVSLVILTAYRFELAKAIVLSITLGLLLQGVTLLPLGQSLFLALEQVLSGKEVFEKCKD